MIVLDYDLISIWCMVLAIAIGIAALAALYIYVTLVFDKKAAAEREASQAEMQQSETPRVQRFKVTVERISE